MLLSEEKQAERRQKTLVNIRSQAPAADAGVDCLCDASGWEVATHDSKSERYGSDPTEHQQEGGLCTSHFSLHVEQNRFGRNKCPAVNDKFEEQLHSPLWSAICVQRAVSEATTIRRERATNEVLCRSRSIRSRVCGEQGQ